MNVLYIVGGEGNRYGSEIVAVTLIEGGKNNGINYTVVTAKSGYVSKKCEELGIRCYIVPFSFFVYREIKIKILNFIKKTLWRCRAELLTFKATKFIESNIDLNTIDLIHTNLIRDLLGGVLSEKYNIPHVWHIHELFKSHYQLSMLRPRQIEWISRHSNCFIAISKTVSNEWINNGLPNDKVKVVYNGLDINAIQKKDHYQTSSLLRLAMVGHLVPAKGQSIVVEQLSKLPDCIKKELVLDLYGDGTVEYKRFLEKAAKQSNIKLTIKGYCSTIGEELYKYDIGINCSRGEGFGLSTVEYMAAGICPVVANTGANEEIISSGVTGYVFDYADEKGLTNLVAYLFEHRNEMIEVSKKAKEEAGLKYPITKMQKEVYSLYSTIVDSY